MALFTAGRDGNTTGSSDSPSYSPRHLLLALKDLLSGIYQLAGSGTVC